jgi:glycosyltransferase involved in cell wall biosynthesis
MRVLFLTQSSEECPASRYRVYQYLPYLEAAGVECHVSPAIPARNYLRVYQAEGAVRKLPHFMVAELKRLITMPRYRRYDVIYFQQWTFPRFYPLAELAAARVNRGMVFDMDEPLYVRPTRRRRGAADLFDPARTVARIVGAASHVVVGNEELRRFAVKHNPNTHVVPTSIDTERYEPKEEYGHARPVVIGWIGSFTTTVYLSMLDEVLRGLSEEYPIVFRVVGAPYFVDGVATEWSPWVYEKEAAEIRQFDIGVMPLRGDEWSRGKSACKALQYMAAGVPAVCTANEVTESVIRDGENGFLARTLEEWQEKLQGLIEDATLRRRIGLAGRAMVEREYSLRVTAPKLLNVLRLAAEWG